MLLEKSAAYQLQTIVDKEDYCESDLLTVTVPLSMPYISDTHGFERIDGELTKDGKIYHYVSRAIQHGMLVLRCLPDRQKTNIAKAKDEYSKQVNDFAISKTSEKRTENKADLAKSFLAKYAPAKSVVDIAGLPSSTKDYSIHFIFQPRNRAQLLPDEPPESC